jgi:CHAT domain-containing protein/Tfp pilus assembly protein PilF
VLNNLAGLYLSKSELERAELLYQRALEISEKVLGPEDPDTAISLNNLAELYKTKGDYGRAEQLLLRVVKIFEKEFGPEHPSTAISLNNLGLLYIFKGDDERGERLLLRALTIFEKKLGPEHPNTASPLNSLASLYLVKDDYGRAEPLLLRIMNIYEKALGSEHPQMAQVLSNYAYLHYLKGEFERTEATLHRVLTINEKALGPEHPDTATSLNSLAVLYHDKSEYERAERQFRRALAIREKAFGAKHSLTANSLTNLALVYLGKGDHANAEPLHHRAAEVQEHNLIQILLAGSEQQKQLYLNTLSRDTYVLVSLSTRAIPTSERAARLALTVILQRKGRVLDATAEQISMLRRRASPQARQLLDQLLATRAQLATLQVNENIKLSPEQRRVEIARLEDEAERLESTISSHSAEFRAQIQPITLAGVQEALPSDSALIEFFIYQPLDAKAKPNERFGKPRYVAYVLKHEGAPKFVELGEADQIDRAVTTWRAALGDEQRADAKRLARALDELVMRPVRGLLTETRRLVISPDGALNLIPFAALVDEQNEYLVKNYAISYLTSGRDLLRLQVARASKQAPLVVADPDFNAPASSQAAAERGQGTKQPSSGAQSSPSSSAPLASLAQFQLERLPGTAAEARALKTLLPEAVVLTGKQATEAALKQATAPRLLHIATHGFFLEDQPTLPPTLNRGVKTSLGLAMNPAPSSGGGNPLLRSGLALTGFNLHRGGEDDGVLTALEATGLNLWGTQMVILSACETGVGAVKNGQGVYGLRRALVLAGAETQVMSLWKVSDEGTSELMSEYYRALQHGEGRAEGLRQVQLRWLKEARRSHPYYWASFIQSGEWANLVGKR